MWFAVIAVGSLSGSLLNSRVVMSLGMRRVVEASYALQLGLTVVALALLGTGAVSGNLAFAVQVIWCMGLFATMGLTMGNLNALAMEPVGHIAGLAASVISALATVLSVLLAIPIGQAFNGTSTPLLIGVAVLIGVSLLVTARFLRDAKA
jgi:MFS transporter, DHA1 family, multidrug resistance protein